MQKIRLHLFFIFCIACSFSSPKLFSQEIVKEVSLVYDISLTTSQNAALASALEGATLSVFVKGNLSRTDMATKVGVESNIYNNNSKSGFILKEYSGQKLMITLTESNWVSRNHFFTDLPFEVVDEEKIINGFTCKRAKVLKSDSYVADIYFMNNFRISNTAYYNCFSKLPGIPVKYIVKKEDKVFTYTLRTISYDNIVSSKFDEPLIGFRKITYEEALKVKGEEK